MKSYSSTCINVCVIGEFISAINLTNFLNNQKGLKLSYLEVEEEHSFSWLIDLENHIYQSDILIVANDDVNLNCTIILSAFKNNIPVILFDEQTYFVAGDYLRTKGSLMLASDTVSGSIGKLLYRNDIDNPVAMGITLPKAISNTQYLENIFTLGVLCNTFKGNLIHNRLIGLETRNPMDASIKLTQLASSQNLICDYLIVPDQEPQFFILNKNPKNGGIEGYSFYSYPILNNFSLLLEDINFLVEKDTSNFENNSERKYNIVGRIIKKVSAGEKLTQEHLSFFEPRIVSVSDSIDTIPWSLIIGCELKVDVYAGQYLNFSDVEIENSLALGLWYEMLKNNFGRRYFIKDK